MESSSTAIAEPVLQDIRRKPSRDSSAADSAASLRRESSRDSSAQTGCKYTAGIVSPRSRVAGPQDIRGDRAERPLVQILMVVVIVVDEEAVVVVVADGGDGGRSCK